MNKFVTEQYLSANAAFEYFKEHCPKFSITYKVIRNLCATGEIASFMAGNKTMVNMNDAISYFNRRYVKVN